VSIEGQTSCRCCGQGGLCLELDRALALLLDILPAGTRLVITSGYRCVRHNRAVGGSRNSQHMEGHAVDMRSPDLSVVDLAAAAEEVPIFRASGIGVYRGEVEWIHLDVRGWRARWGELDTKRLPDGSIKGRAVPYEKALAWIA